MPAVMLFGCAEQARRLREAKGKKKVLLRLQFSMQAMSESEFIKTYCLNKEMFRMILTKMSVPSILNDSKLYPEIQLAILLHYLSIGDKCLPIGENCSIGVTDSGFAKIMETVIPVLEKALCEEWIILQTSSQELMSSQEYFAKNFGFPGVIGCLDSIDIKIDRPSVNPELYKNQNDCFILKTMLVWNYNMEIMAVDSNHPGTCQKDFIWNNSQAKQFYANSLLPNSWLLADANYALETFVMTPYKNPQNGSVHEEYNKKHEAACKKFKETLALLKNRFGCLKETLCFEPNIASQIINVCCAIHNMCCKQKIPMDTTEPLCDQDDQLVINSLNPDSEEALQIREQILKSFEKKT